MLPADVSSAASGDARFLSWHAIPSRSVAVASTHVDGIGSATAAMAAY